MGRKPILCITSTHALIHGQVLHSNKDHKKRPSWTTRRTTGRSVTSLGFSIMFRVMTFRPFWKHGQEPFSSDHFQTTWVHNMCNMCRIRMSWSRSHKHAFNMAVVNPVSNVLIFICHKYLSGRVYSVWKCNCPLQV